MSVDNFLDSNLFVYLFDRKAEDKRQRAKELVHTHMSKGSACISYQVVQETMKVFLRTGASHEEAHLFFNTVLSPFWTVNPTRALYRCGFDIQTRYHFSFYDSLIVAAALEAGCKTLLTEDLQDKQTIEGLTVRNPFT